MSPRRFLDESRTDLAALSYLIEAWTIGHTPSLDEFIDLYAIGGVKAELFDEVRLSNAYFTAFSRWLNR